MEHNSSIKMPKAWSQINTKQVLWLSVNRSETQHFNICMMSKGSMLLQIVEFHHIHESDAAHCANGTPYFIEESLIKSLPQEFRDLGNEEGS